MSEKRFERRLNKDNIKFNTQNPVWDNKKEDALNVFEMIDLLNELHEENQQLKKENHNRRVLLVDELRGLFQMYLTQCRSISEEAIITLIRNDVKKRVFEVFDE